MKSFLISVLGDDKPGLVDGLSEIILGNNGDWIAVSYTHLTLPTNREV